MGGDDVTDSGGDGVGGGVGSGEAASVTQAPGRGGEDASTSSCTTVLPGGANGATMARAVRSVMTPLPPTPEPWPALPRKLPRALSGTVGCVLERSDGARPLPSVATTEALAGAGKPRGCGTGATTPAAPARGDGACPALHLPPLPPAAMPPASPDAVDDGRAPVLKTREGTRTPPRAGPLPPDKLLPPPYPTPAWLVTPLLPLPAVDTLAGRSPPLVRPGAPDTAPPPALDRPPPDSTLLRPL